MSGAEEEWAHAAMTDDTVVADILLRLHGAPPLPPPKRTSLRLEWSVRQRRSKNVSANTNPKKQTRSHRASPSTPLSWSGATCSGGSGGAGGGGSEESSRLHIQKLTRSKDNCDGEKAASKRSRKKKTLVELKDEESLLLKERRELKREIAALRMNLEKQRAENENLKRMKTELSPLPVREESISDQLLPNTALPSSSSNDSSDPKDTAPSGAAFVLPDLNMPFEDDPCPDAIYGVC